MPLTKDQILSAQDVKPPFEFHVPEWSDTVFLRHPTANDRDAWELYAQANKGQTKSLWRAQLAAMLICDEKGNRLFTTDAEIRQLGEHSAAALHRIWERGLELMNFTEMEVNELEKN